MRKDILATANGAYIEFNRRGAWRTAGTRTGVMMIMARNWTADGLVFFLLFFLALYGSSYGLWLETWIFRLGHTCLFLFGFWIGYGLDSE
jgi:hypothetical protein